MYRLYLTNFGYFTPDSFSSLDAAVTGAKKIGFEVTIYRDSDIVASWSVIGGLHRY